MAGSRLLKAIHVVGYLTTAIVLFELAGLGYLAWNNWSRSQRMDAQFREATRTHDGALGVGYTDLLESDAAKAYQAVRPPPGESTDALGFVSMPSFSAWSAVSLRLPRGADVAQGEVVVVQLGNETHQLTISQVRTFTVPKAEYLAAAQRIDTLTDGWPGSAGGFGCMDGVPVAFERAKVGHITSGVGNASCDAHYAAVDRIMTSLLSRFGPNLAKAPPKPPPPPKTQPPPH